MSAITDFKLILETLAGKTLTAAQLSAIGDTFKAKDLFRLGNFVSSTYAIEGGLVVDAGSGYTNEDLLLVDGGTGVPAQLKAIVELGVVIDLEVVVNGDYTEAPTNPVSFTGGTGTGLTANLEIAQFDTPREPSDEEVAQLGLDTLLKFCKRLHIDYKKEQKTLELDSTRDADLAAEQALAEQDFV